MKEEAEIFFFSGLDELLDDAKEISRDLQRVPVLTRVLEYTLTGWLYHEVRADQGCVLLGMGVIIPPP